jgi:hypothetical protein
MRPTSQSDQTEGKPPARSANAARRRTIGFLTAGVLVAALIAGLIAVVSAGEDSGAGATSGDFGTHYEGLEDRRLAADVPTMSDSPAPGGQHIHPSLSVYANGEEIPIPINIGIDPSNPPEMMAGLHTHDSSGTIHVENAADPTLGQFFEIWGVPFSAKRLGPFQAEGDRRVRLWVDGEPSREFGDLVLEDGMEVVVAYGSAAELPPDIAG